MARTFQDVIKQYDGVVKGIDAKARGDRERAYGGSVRAGKGALVEAIARDLVRLAWESAGGDSDRLSFGHKTLKVPLNRDYLDRIEIREVADYIREHIDEYTYGIRIDVPVLIDESLVIGIECKAYTENAMLKRILVDFTLLRQIFPQIACVLLQLESQLTGDYSQPDKPIVYGSRSTHTLLSHFDIDITTLLEGERRVDRPIHLKEYFKPLSKDNLQIAVTVLQDLLRRYVKNR